MRRLAITLIVGALAAAGCGGGDAGSQSQADPEQGQQAVQSAEDVSATDTATVLRAENSITTRCGLTKDLQGSDIPLDRAITMLQEVYRQDPDATYASGSSTETRNMRTVVSDNAATLRTCGQTAAATKLASVLKSNG